MIIHTHDVEWYAAKLDRGEPFSALSYGDGEFMVASGRHVGKALSAAREVVTEQLRDEMRASFGAGDYGPDGTDTRNEILRGSDPSILDPSTYRGRDVAAVQACHDQAAEWIARVPEWVDGTVWDVAAREGRLAPLLRALRRRPVVLVASRAVAKTRALRRHFTVEVPESNAAAFLADPEWPPVPQQALGEATVVVACCGLSAVPLIMRLRRRCPGATYLDLGSALDVFARTGAERGWRQEMYRDDQAWIECIAKNMEGVE